MGSEYPSTMAFFHVSFVNSCTFLLLKANQLLEEKRLAMEVKKKKSYLEGDQGKNRERCTLFSLKTLKQVKVAAAKLLKELCVSQAHSF